MASPPNNHHESGGNLVVVPLKTRHPCRGEPNVPLIRNGDSAAVEEHHHHHHQQRQHDLDHLDAAAVAAAPQLLMTDPDPDDTDSIHQNNIALLENRSDHHLRCVSRILLYLISYIS